MKDKPSTEYALMGALMSGPMHGYEIMQILETGLEPAWRVSTSQLYALLKRLESDGLISSILEAQDTRPSKRVFSLRPSGRERFLVWLRSPAQHMRDLRIEFLAKLLFFRSLGAEGASDLVDAQVQVLEEMKQRLNRSRRTERDPFKRLVFGFRSATIQGWLNWLTKEAVKFARGEDNHDGTL